jgi:hypothetical protein
MVYAVRYTPRIALSNFILATARCPKCQSLLYYNIIKEMIKMKNYEKAKEREREIEEMKKLGEFAGIEDLMAVCEEYQGLIQIATQYLKETSPKFTFSTTDSTS